MNATTRTRLKWELAIVVVLVVAIANHKRLNAYVQQQFASDPSAGNHQSEDERLDATIPRGFATYPHYSWEPRPLVELGLNRVEKWEQGTIALPAIYYRDKANNGQHERPKPGQKTLVLINDTDDAFEVPCQDGDIYIKLEVKLDGKWRRAQYHVYSWCGDSYTSRTLPPHSFVPVLGYQPTTGRMATSRFAVKNGAKDVLLSPEFKGVYSPDDVAMSDFDQLALREASLQDLKAFLQRKEFPTLMWGNQSISLLRQSAWRSLTSGKHDPGETLIIAREVMVSDSSLESNPELVEQMLVARHTTRAIEENGRGRIHGFAITEPNPNGK